MSCCPAVGETWTRIGEVPPRLDARFADWEVRPLKSWNFGLRLDAADPDPDTQVERQAVGPVPFALEAAPVRVWVQGARLKDWRMQLNSAAPPSPVRSSLPMDPVCLVPFGSARIRIAEFPRVEPTGDGAGH